jgi:hypothetical protein
MERVAGARALQVGLPVALLLSASPALAYVRAVADSGAPLWWKTTCIRMDMALATAPPSLSAEQFFQAGVAAAEVWSHGALACTSINLTVAKGGSEAEITGLDGRNVIVFRQDVWCEHPVPDDPSARYCYPSNALAVTTVFKSKTTGEIVDADMELNAVRFTWADLAAHPELANATTADFQNTVTHELGHVLGFAHPCWSATDGTPHLLDNSGLPELDCSAANLPASTIDSTMFPSVVPSDTLRRTLAADDQQAACDAYPLSARFCPGSGSGGCSLLPTATEAAAQGTGDPLPKVLVGLGLALGLATLLRGWRRRRTPVATDLESRDGFPVSPAWAPCQPDLPIRCASMAPHRGCTKFGRWDRKPPWIEANLRARRELRHLVAPAPAQTVGNPGSPLRWPVQTQSSCPRAGHRPRRR